MLIQPDNRYRIDRNKLRKALGLGRKLDPDFQKEYPQTVLETEGGLIVADVIVKRILPALRIGRRTNFHRIHVRCSCGREVPAGYFPHHRSACNHLLNFVSEYELRERYHNHS